MEQRRIFERRGASLKIKYEVVEKAPGEKIATSRDIGGGGIRLALDENLEVGTNLKLVIEIPKENKITTAYGKVVWTRKTEVVGAKVSHYYETGIQFIKVDPLSIGKIFKFLEAEKG